MKNVIKFPVIPKEVQKVNVNYLDFLANSHDYKNVSQFPNKKYDISFNPSPIYSNYNTLIANKLTQKETYNNEELESSNVAFLILSGILVLAYILVALTGITTAKEMCGYVLSPLLKTIILVVSFNGVLFSTYYASKIIKNIRYSKAVITMKQSVLLILSVLYTFAFIVTPLCLVAFNIACNK